MTTELHKWLEKTNRPKVPFTSSETSLSWSGQNAWARHPDTQRWWHLRLESTQAVWTESWKTCSKYEL